MSSAAVPNSKTETFSGTVDEEPTKIVPILPDELGVTVNMPKEAGWRPQLALDDGDGFDSARATATDIMEIATTTPEIITGRVRLGVLISLLLK
ncbi:MAG: hypothetical protein HY369_02390 [Candidatus Aenigmarchaeota archaeon]|nr:hypothetical protein [Candidatus Aenigmarchaeota archaeon]